MSNDAYQLYLFTRQYPGVHGFANDAQTRKAVAWLASRGYVGVNQYGQVWAVNADGTPR